MEKKSFRLIAMLFVAVLTLGFTSCGDDDDNDDVEEKNASGSKIKKISVNGVDFNMIFVDGGTFMMGATQEQCIYGDKVNDDEFPVHKVTLSSYYLAETEVTRELFNAVMGTSYEKLYHPFEGDYKEHFEPFISKLNEMTGLKFRFPTEAEWEFAARGGNKSKGYVYSGSNNRLDVGWYYCNSGDAYLSESNWNYWTLVGNHYDTHVVATKFPNELGFYDMSGNLNEWCSDWYANYTKGDQVNPKGPATGSERVARGGSYGHFSNAARCSHRNKYSSEYVYNGLRLAMDK